MGSPLCREVLGPLLTAILVVLATEQTQAIRWLGLHKSAGLEGVPVWNSTTGCGVARRSKLLTRGQARLCRSAPEILPQILRAASQMASTCQDLLQDRRWNCSSLLMAPSFSPDLTTGTREQALVYALSSAAMIHTVARACAGGSLPQCGCSTPPQNPPDGDFKWGGCGDNTRWAVQFAHQFLDSVEKHRPDRRYRERMRLRASGNSSEEREHQQRLLKTLVNLHNNRAGRRAVESRLQSQCKCHGVSGSCSVRTCWRALPPRLKEIGLRLLKLYPRAVQVRTDMDGEGHRLLPLRGGRYTQDDLLYLVNSPDYCQRDYRTGSLGTYGRKCNSTGTGYGSCASMCCGRGYRTRMEERRERCHCKYYWCCYVKCKTCHTWEQLHECN